MTDVAAPVNLLLVEDNGGDRRLIHEYLGTLGGGAFVIRETETLAGAFAQLKSAPADLVLLDLGLPDSWGLDTLSALRAVAPRIPIVVFTGSDDEEQALRAIKAGAQDYLVKGQLTKAAILRTVRYTFERYRLEDALRASEEKFRTIADFTGDWEYWIRPDDTVVYVNPACRAITGYGPEDFIADPELIMKIVHPDDQEVFRTHHRQAVGRGDSRTLECEFRIVSRDGAVRWMGHICHPVIGPDGSNKGRRVSNRDVTARKEAEARTAQAVEEVRRLNADLEARVASRTADLDGALRELESFSYSVSHDLRAPLRSLDGFSQALLEEYAEQLDDTGKKYLERIRAASRRMAALIDDLLQLSRVVRRPLACAPVNLSALAQEVAADLRTESPGRQVTLVVEPGLVVQGDGQLLRIVLDNLLGNAWKFTSRTAAARVEFGSRTVAGRREYFVRDNGAGFDQAYADKLFVAFQRLHAESQFPGTGIGLTIVKRILLRHGGDIRGEGRPGEGAEFTFTLQEAP